MSDPRFGYRLNQDGFLTKYDRGMQHSVNQSINQSVSHSNNHSINQPINHSINQPIVDHSINQPINHSINQSISQQADYRNQHHQFQPVQPYDYQQQFHPVPAFTIQSFPNHYEQTNQQSISNEMTNQWHPSQSIQPTNQSFQSINQSIQSINQSFNSGDEENIESDVEDEPDPRISQSDRPVATSINQLQHQNGRIAQACETCRKKKRRCDGSFPTCSSCDRALVQCSYSLGFKKRGPQAGVVKELRAQVQSLKLQLEQERNRSKRDSEKRDDNQRRAGRTHQSFDQPTNQSPGQMLAAMISTSHGLQQAKLFCYNYFAMLNNVLFPMLDQSVFDDCCVRYLPSMENAPAVWHLTFAAVLAQGAGIYGDNEYARAACEIARVSAAEIFDQPSEDSIRGLLVLTFFTLSTNQLSRTSCFLAVISRMCSIVDMSPEIPLIAKFLEHMICCVRTFFHGLDLMPEGSFAMQQRANFAADWARYERLRKFIGQSEDSSHKLAEFNQAIRQSIAESGEPLDFFGPPDSRDLDESNLRWDMFTTMVAMSEARGEYFADAKTSVYYHLCVLTKCERSHYIRDNALMVAVCFFKSQALFYVNELDQAAEYAALVSDLTTIYDLAHSAFNSLMLHFVSQVHLRTNDNQRLCQSLRMAQAIADKWELAIAPLDNIRARIAHRTMHPTEPFSSVGPPASQAYGGDPRMDQEMISALTSSDRSRAQHLLTQSLNQINVESLGLSVNQAFTSSIPPKHTRISAALDSVFQPFHPSSSQTDNTLPLPTLADTIAGIHPLWASLWHPEMKLMRKSVVDASLRSDHPHPHIAQLVSPPSIKVEIELEQERDRLSNQARNHPNNMSMSNPSRNSNLADGRRYMHVNPSYPADVLGQTDVSSSSSSSSSAAESSGSGSPVHQVQPLYGYHQTDRLTNSDPTQHSGLPSIHEKNVGVNNSYSFNHHRVEREYPTFGNQRFDVSINSHFYPTLNSSLESAQLGSSVFDASPSVFTTSAGVKSSNHNDNYPDAGVFVFPND